MITRALLMSLFATMVLSACSASKTAHDNKDVYFTEDTSIVLDSVQMNMYIAGAESQLLLLEQQSANRCISGQIKIAQSYLTRATSEHNAEMEKDAFITLIEFDRQIRKIHCINQYIKQQLGCGYTNQKVVLKRWYDEGDFDQCESESTVASLPLAISKPTPIPPVKEIAKKVNTTVNNPMIITETLHDFDQDQIKPIYYPSLNKLIELINIYPNSTLLISGHTDTTGSNEYNNQLSKRRAESIVKYFTDNGIEASKIVIKNKGESNVREVEESDVSRVFNRYTSITLFLDTRAKMDL